MPAAEARLSRHAEEASQAAGAVAALRHAEAAVALAVEGVLEPEQELAACAGLVPGPVGFNLPAQCCLPGPVESPVLELRALQARLRGQGLTWKQVKAHQQVRALKLLVVAQVRSPSTSSARTGTGAAGAAPAVSVLLPAPPAAGSPAAAP
jgi:hypothetical protein